MRAGTLEVISRELNREIVVGRRAVAVIGVGVMVACLAMAAEIRFYLPFTPVPVTLQTFFVLVAGAGMGPRLGTIALSGYLALGTLGLPVFTGAWLGKTTGYLLGFVVAGWLIGTVARRTPRASTLRIVMAMAAGSVVIYLFGAAYLALSLGLGPWQAALAGVIWFLPGDAVKLAAAAAFCRSYRDRLRALFP